MIKRRTFLGGLAAVMAAVPSLARASLAPSKPKLALVDASNQSGHSLVVSPLNGSLNVGDIITIGGVEAWNRNAVREEFGPSGRPREFVVTAHAEAGDTVIHLYPPLDGRGRYRTVVGLPANRAEIKRYEPKYARSS